MSASREQPTPPRPPIAIKGRGRDIRVVVEVADDLAAVERSLRDQLQRRAGAFFTGAPVTLEMPGPAIDFELAGRLAAAIHDAGMHVSTVSSASTVAGGENSSSGQSRSVAEASSTASGSGGPPWPNQASSAAALVVERTLRGGQRLEHDGDVIVIGDVNPGAELVAGGSVVVWGRLRGTVEAGAGRQGAFVCALDLSPSQLLIGAAIARAPDHPARNPAPEIARDVGGRIEVEDWR